VEHSEWVSFWKWDALQSMEEAHLVAYFLATVDAETVAEVQRRVADNLRATKDFGTGGRVACKTAKA